MATATRARGAKEREERREKKAPHEGREAYIQNTRLSVAGVVARVCAAGLVMGLIGGLATHNSPSALFDMAKHEGGFVTELKKPPLGFFIGPALILILLPVAKGKAPATLRKRGYLARIVAASVLWLGGLVALIAQVASLDPRFTIEAGTYVGGTLITMGLLSTLAMWPTGLEAVEVDKKGNVVGAGPAPVSTPKEPPSNGKPMAAAHPDRSKAPRANRPPAIVRWILIPLGTAVVLFLGYAVIHDFVLNDNGLSPAAKEASSSWNRLDDSMTNAFNATDRIVTGPWNCMAKADPYGGPSLAACAPGAERAARQIRRSSRRVGAVYASSPAWLRKIYRPGYAAAQRVLSTHATQLDAMAQYGHVHGTSSSAGSAEFDRIKSTQATAIQADAAYKKAIAQVRTDWYRYAKQRWGMTFH